ncbi:nuclear transport factor 2 family protein [Trujillonella endophytica]|uniref:SnoaL-like domain-containing protein n=1 Tax=Trujillonella endophytica TaxID=673521 RepID=A0A1H8Q6C9_9ACTN|nr:nuclear transport factor 2 family protein [Trujillella endophytica]SEO49313.1 SnoaL-like domain-containing protein [Trujillella endophytica]
MTDAYSPADRQDVEDLLSAYVLALDTDDVDAAMALFAEGAEFRTYGRAFVGEKLRRMFETAPKGQHLTGRSLVTPTAEGATVRSQLVFLPADRSEHRLTIYDDEVVRDGDRWLFRSRTVRFMDSAGRLQERPE